jgi:hypothetical protein
MRAAVARFAVTRAAFAAVGNLSSDQGLRGGPRGPRSAADYLDPLGLQNPERPFAHMSPDPGE